MTNNNKCKFKRPEDGSQCNAWPMQGTDFCFLHSPSIDEEEKKAAQSRGGQNSRKQYEPIFDELEIKTPKDVTTLINRLIIEIRAGRTPEKMGTTIGFLASILLKSLEQEQITNKIKQIQNAISNEQEN